MKPDLKRAFAAYVSGRNGGWDSEQKLPPTAEGSDSNRSQGATPSGATSRYGVPVPKTLAFQRGPGTWRRNVEDGSDG